VLAYSLIEYLVDMFRVIEVICGLSNGTNTDNPLMTLKVNLDV